MRHGTVTADQAAAINPDHGRQVALEGQLLEDLVEGALEERRIDARHRLAPGARQPGGERHRVLLADTYVEVALGKFFFKGNQPRAAGHRRGDGTDPFVAAGLFDQFLYENFTVAFPRGARGGWIGQTDRNLVPRRRMELLGILRRVGDPAAFAGDRVQ